MKVSFYSNHIIFITYFCFTEVVMAAWTTEKVSEADSRLSKKKWNTWLMQSPVGMLGIEWQHVCYVTLESIN